MDYQVQPQRSQHQFIGLMAVRVDGMTALLIAVLVAMMVVALVIHGKP